MESSPNHFRPSKRRKFYRKRTAVEDGDNDEEQHDVPSLQDQALPPSQIHVNDDVANVEARSFQPDPQASHEASLPLSELLRLRRNLQRKHAGVSFKSGGSADSDIPLRTTLELAKSEKELPAAIQAMDSRFAPQTGRVTEVTDKHMYDHSP